MVLDAYEIAIDQILEGAGGDVRLALRTVLIQNLELEARLQAALSGKMPIGESPASKRQGRPN